MTKAKLSGRSPISTIAVMIRRWRLWRRGDCFNLVTPRWLVTIYFPWSILNCQVEVTPLASAKQLSWGAFPEDEQRAGDEHRGIGPYDDAQEQGEGKVVQHLPSGQGQRNEDQNDGQRHNDGPAQDLVHSIVDDRLERVPMARLEIFPDPVEDHDGVCQGVPRQRQEGGDDQEGDLLLQHVENPQHCQHVVKGRDRRRNPEPELKAGRNVDNDAQHRNRDGDERILLELLPDGRADLVTGIDDERDRREILLEDLQDLLGNFLLNSRLGLDTDQQLVALGDILDLNLREPVTAHGLPGLFDRNRLVKLQLDGRPPCEVDPQVRRPPPDLDQRDQADEHKHARQCKGVPPQTHEIDGRFAEDLQHIRL